MTGLPLYRVPEYSVCLTFEDMPAVMDAFDAFTRRAIGNVPRPLAIRMKFARRFCSKPRHIGILVDIVADSYRYQLEEKKR